MPSYTIQELNGIPYLVIKDDGINISRLKFPHDMEIGLNNPSYNSNLLVKGTISGSIHNTKDGLSYLVAGSGISIASASNGQVTITSAGGGGGGAISAVTNGANNRIATFTSADALNGEANLTFDGTTFEINSDILVKKASAKIKNHANMEIRTSGSLSVYVDDDGTGGGDFRVISGSQFLLIMDGDDQTTTFPGTDVYITNDHNLRLNTGGTIFLDNDSDSEIYLSSSSGLSLDVDSNNILNLYADNNMYQYLGDHQAGTHSINSFHAGSNTFNLNRDDMDFRVHTDNHYATFFVDAGDDTVIIGGQNFNSNPTASQLVSKGYGNDVKVLLSGTYGSKDGTDRGVILMAGDTAVSGNLYIVGDTSSKRKITASGSMEIRSINGTTSVVGDNNVNVWVGYDGKGSDQSFSIYKGSGGYEQIFVVNEDKSVRIFGELDVENNLVVHLDYDSDNSNSYFGTKNGTGTFNQVFYEDGRAYFNWGRQSGGDFIVNGDNDYGLIFVDAGEDAVALGSSTDGSPAWSEFTDTGTDVKILLSGTAGSMGGTSRGTTLVSGDFVTSGSSVFNEGGGSNDFRVESSNNPNMLIVKGSTDRVGIGRVSSPQANLHLKEVTPTFRIQRSNNGNDSTLEFAGSAGSVGASMIHLASSNDLVFSTHDGSSPQEILRLGGHQVSDVRQIILLSGSEVAASSMQPQHSDDVNFFVSGAIGSLGTSVRGSSVFGGDLAASGSIYTGGNLLSLDSTLSINASSEVSSFVSSNKNATYSSTTEFNTNRADVDFEVNTDDYYGTFFIDGNDNTVIVGHEEFDSSPSASEVSGYGNDVKILLSGSAGSKGTTDRGVVLVAADLVVSGTAYLTSPGSMLSFRHFNTANAEDFDAPTSFNFIEGSTSGKAYITFDAPTTGNVELEFSVYVEQNQSGADLFMALSTNGSTWSTISNTDVKVFDGDETDDGYRTFKWILTGLTSGTSYTYYFGAESNSSTGIDLNWGKTSGSTGYPPLIMKATALPNTIT